MSLVAINGCSDDDDDNPVNPGTPQSTQLTGAFVGAGDGGRMTVTIPLASSALAPRLGGSAPVNVTGTLSPDAGGTVNLTGSYDADGDAIVLAGGGYTLAGLYDGTAPVAGIAGDYTGPNGTGGFAVAVGGSSTVSVYCAEYEGQSDSGRLNLIIVGNTVNGGVALTNGTIYGFEGTVTGIAPNQTITVNDEVETGIVVAAQASLNSTTGQITNGTYTITVEGLEEDSGTWQGSTSCMTAPTN